MVRRRRDTCTGMLPCGHTAEWHCAADAALWAIPTGLLVPSDSRQCPSATGEHDDREEKAEPAR